MTRLSQETELHAKMLLVAVHAPYNRTKNIDTYYQEFLNLVKTNGVHYLEVIYVKLREVDSGYFFTKGKLEELKRLCDDLEIEHVIFSDQLSPQQERNLSEFLHCRVFDRTALILEIFEKAAHTAEGKLQVEIARLRYRRARLAGKGIHMSQQAGMIGVRGGPGESLKERETRLIDKEILKIKKHLERIEKSRVTQSKQRRKSGLKQLCLIGYTNAGKSTILNALTKSDVYAADVLFATLGTTVRELYIHKEKIGVLSDTVGFIQNLPHTLINAFKSTLSELDFADLLLHVVDISDPNWVEHIQVVLHVLDELGIEKDMVFVFNKVDKLTDEEREEIVVPCSRYRPHVFASAESKEGLAELREFLYDWKQTQ